MERYLKIGRKTVKLEKGDYVLNNHSCLQFINKDAEYDGPMAMSKASFERFLKMPVQVSYKKYGKGHICEHYTYQG
jgi:hypothetical protein